MPDVFPATGVRRACESCIRSRPTCAGVLVRIDPAREQRFELRPDPGEGGERSEQRIKNRWAHRTFVLRRSGRHLWRQPDYARQKQDSRSDNGARCQKPKIAIGIEFS